MRLYVLDASVLLRWFEGGPGADRIEELIVQAGAGRAQVAISSVNWGEVYYVVARRQGETRAVSFSSRFRNLPIEIVAADWRRAESAALFRERFHVPYADSFAGSLTADQGAVLVTADYDFKGAEDAIAVEFLPVKRRNPPR